MRNLIFLAPLAMLACGGGGDTDTDGTTAPTTSDDTCPDTGCAPSGPSCENMGYFAIWGQWGYDADLQEFKSVDISGYPTTADVLVAWADSGLSITCFSYHDFSGFDIVEDKENGGVRFTGTLGDAYGNSCDLARFCEDGFGGYSADTYLSGVGLDFRFGGEDNGYFGDVEGWWGYPDDTFQGSYAFVGYEDYTNDWGVLSYADNGDGTYDYYTYRPETESFQGGLTTGAYFAFTPFVFQL